MKKLLYFAFILTIFFSLPDGFCADSQSTLKQKIEMIEKEINTYPDGNLSLEERLKNIEIYVLGTPKTGDLSQRINSVSKALGIFDFNQTTETPKYEIEDNSIANYPAVDKLEQENFGKIFKNENIYSRLDRLEKKAFGKTSYKSLNDRVSDLQEKLKPAPTISKSDDIPYTKANPYYSPNSNTYNYYSPNTADPLISKIEYKLWKQSFDKEDVPKRLSRIEDKIFGQKFENDNDKDRLERIKSVLKAQKSGGEYKANKFAKYAATGLQIGGIVLLILAMIL